MGDPETDGGNLMLLKPDVCAIIKELLVRLTDDDWIVQLQRVDDNIKDYMLAGHGSQYYLRFKAGNQNVIEMGIGLFTKKPFIQGVCTITKKGHSWNFFEPRLESPWATSILKALKGHGGGND